MTALADGLYILSCYLYVVLILILFSFEGYYVQEIFAIKSRSPIKLNKQSLFSSCVDACIYIMEWVSMWLVYHSLHASLDSPFVSWSWAGLQVDLLFAWTVVFLQVLCSAQIAPAEVSWHQESNQKRSERGNSERSIHESGQTQIRGCKLRYASILFFFSFYIFLSHRSFEVLSRSSFISFFLFVSSLSSFESMSVSLPLQRS